MDGKTRRRELALLLAPVAPANPLVSELFAPSGDEAFPELASVLAAADSPASGSRPGAPEEAPVPSRPVPRLPRRFDARWSARLAARPRSSVIRRRAEVRKALSIPIEVVHPDWNAPALLATSDLSPTGACVHGARPAVPGDPVVVSFRLPGRPAELSFFGEVVRVLRDALDDGPVASGFAVRFVDAGPLDRLRIRDALRGIPPRLPAASRPVAAV